MAVVRLRHPDWGSEAAGISTVAVAKQQHATAMSTHPQSGHLSLLVRRIPTQRPFLWTHPLCYVQVKVTPDS